MGGWLGGQVWQWLALQTPDLSLQRSLCHSVAVQPSIVLVVVRLLSGCDPAVIRLLRPCWTVLAPGCYLAVKPHFGQFLMILARPVVILLVDKICHFYKIFRVYKE